MLASLSSGLPFCEGLTRTYIFSMPGHERSNFSIRTLPMKPVPPVTNIDLPSKYLGIESSMFTFLIVTFFSTNSEEDGLIFFYHITEITHSQVMKILVEAKILEKKAYLIEC